MTINREALPGEERLGKMLKVIIIPLIVTLLYGGVRFANLKSIKSDPLEMVKALESRVINEFGQIFKWNLDKREAFRKQLQKLVKKQEYNDSKFLESYSQDADCYPLELSSANTQTLSQGKKDDILMACVREGSSQVISKRLNPQMTPLFVKMER